MPHLPIFSHLSIPNFQNNQLYAHGIYIRPLNEDEKAEEAKYNSQMNFYKEVNFFVIIVMIQLVSEGKNPSLHLLLVQVYLL